MLFSIFSHNFGLFYSTLLSTHVPLFIQDDIADAPHTSNVHKRKRVPSRKALAATTDPIDDAAAAAATDDDEYVDIPRRNTSRKTAAAAAATAVASKKAAAASKKTTAASKKAAAASNKAVDASRPATREKRKHCTDEDDANVEVDPPMVDVSVFSQREVKKFKD